MRPDERELTATRLRQIASEVGMELSAERLERLVELLESTVEGVRAAGELGPEERVPTSVPSPDEEQEP